MSDSGSGVQPIDILRLRPPRDGLLGVPLSSTAIDRGYQERERPGVVAELLDSEDTRFLLLHDGHTWHNGERLVLANAVALRDMLTPGQLQSYVKVYLGSVETALCQERTDIAVGEASGGEIRTPIVLVVLEELTPGVLEYFGSDPDSLRQTAPVIDRIAASLWTESLAIWHWHETHLRCPRCGAPTEIAHAGWVRVCTEDGSEHYPRTDPAIIVAVLDADERVLLARSAAWDRQRFSLVAGFVEPGETFEDAVAREVLEEVGVQCTDPVYFASQPWPFPASLMVGFLAHTVHSSPQIAVDNVEIADAQWISREELPGLIQNGQLVLPAPVSIARSIIEHWFGAPIADKPVAAVDFVPRPSELEVD